MIQIEYLPIVLTGIGIIVSILYYAMVLRNQNTTRQAQLLMQINNISRPENLRADRTIKVVDGPFHAYFADPFGTVVDRMRANREER